MRAFRVLAVLIGLAGVAVVVVAGTRNWAYVSVPDLQIRDSALTGRRAAPSVVPIALAAGAGVIVMVTSGRIVRLLVAAALVAGGAALAITSGHARASAAATMSRALETGIGLFTQNSTIRLPAGSLSAATADPTIWPWISLAGGVLIASSGLVGLVTGLSWPGPASRFEAPAERPADQPGQPAATPAAADDTRTWDALSRGDDPT